MRKPLIAANWKMYKTPAESIAFIDDFLPLVANQQKTEIVLCPPMICLGASIAATKGTQVHIGAQTMDWHDNGAYTGETSPVMLNAIGATHVLIGHSERRQYFNETDETVNHKLKAALAHKLVPIVCVGEHKAERESGHTNDVLKQQLTVGLQGIDPAAAAPLVIAYEPVWAIGTGLTATPQIAEDAHQFIRSQIAEILSPAIAASTRILYGGSVKPDNAASLCCLANIDGALVGGASLDPTSFAQIVANSSL
ncbi:MAG TPA: triose-phosphate isomerase [Edaphobacter sp.]|uniref:triose-phosphate isomerase n=1 Tax=Edaphobacter sp. TaxID=1934404 RepID=UPI002BDE5CF7|nr:triose-phosphate isomerase [Edaphobacter sp.]HUZ95816.1 triose-phosphate isomerase [Edaphobacter sp.]